MLASNNVEWKFQGKRCQLLTAHEYFYSTIVESQSPSSVQFLPNVHLDPTGRKIVLPQDGDATLDITVN